MLDKLQIDLQERMTTVMELSAKFRLLQQELAEIGEPIDISRDRSIRGMSPLPREIADRFVIQDTAAVRRDVFVDPSNFHSYRRGGSARTVSTNAGTNADEYDEDVNSPILNMDSDVVLEMSVSSLGNETNSTHGVNAARSEVQGAERLDSLVSLPTLSATSYRQRPLSGLEPPNSSSRATQNSTTTCPISTSTSTGVTSSSFVHNALFSVTPDGGLTPLAPVREANLLRDRGYDEHIEQLEEDKALFAMIAKNLDKMRANLATEFERIKKELYSEKGEIQRISENRSRAKKTFNNWKRQWRQKHGREASRADMTANPSRDWQDFDELDTLMREKAELVTSTTAELMDMRQEMEDMDYHLKIARERSKRGVSKERRLFKQKYMNIDDGVNNYENGNSGIGKVEDRESENTINEIDFQAPAIRLTSAMRKKGGERLGSVSNVSFADDVE